MDKCIVPTQIPDSLYFVIATLALRDNRTLGDQIVHMLQEYLAGYGIRPT